MLFLPLLVTWALHCFQATLMIVVSVRKLFTLRQTIPEQVEVKVKENWRQDEGLLKYYGYGGQIRAM